MSEIVVERYCPVVDIYDKRPAPARPPYSYEVLADKALKSTTVWPGLRHNVRVLELSNDAFFYQDALPGQLPFKARALILDYDLIFHDAGATRWDIVPTAKETVARGDARRGYEATKEELDKVKTDTLSPTELEAHKLALATVEDRLFQLSQDGKGFLTTFRNLYDNGGVDGFIYELSVPNIPLDLIGKDDLLKDGAVTLRMLRAEPDEEQGEAHNLIYKFTNGTTQYALVFGRNNSVQWWHYRNMTGAARLKLEDTLNKLEDNGRLTGADNEQLRQWQEDIESIKESAKKNGRSEQKLLSNEKAAIKTLKDKIAERKEQKQNLTAADEKQRAELLKKLFYEQVNVNLQEDTRSLYNRIFDVTVRFLRKGQVQIQLDKQPAWTWTNKGIAKLRGYYTMLPARSRLIIHSDGGTFGVSVGRPRHKSAGSLWTADFKPGFVLEPGDIRWNIDGDFISRVFDEGTGIYTCIGPYGTKVEASVKEITPQGVRGGITKDPTYQLQIELYADPQGAYTPEVHYIQWLSLAGDMAPLGAVPTWQSLPSGDRYAKQLVQDVLSQDAEDKTPHYEVFIRDRDGESALPTDLARCEAELSLISISDNVEYSFGRCIVKRAEFLKRRKLQAIPFLRLFGADDAQVKLHVLGLEEILNKEIRYPFPGNNKTPNQFIRELCQNAGLRPEEYSLVSDGDMGIPALKPAAAGEAPEIKPATSARYWEYLQDIVSKHCRGYRLVVRPLPAGGSSLALELDTVRDRPELAYSTSLKASNPLHIKKGFDVYQDLSEYYTEAIFIGAVDPQTGKRWAGSKSIPQATDERFKGKSLYHVGEPRPYYSPPDDTLLSYEDAVEAARIFMEKGGRPPWYCVITVAYNPTVRAGDLIRVDGIKCVVENINRGSLKAAKREVPKMTLACRYYEDVLLQAA